MSKRVSPVTFIIERLRLVGIPSLSALTSKFSNVEEYQEFVMLVREYLPEYERAILRELSIADQIAEFAKQFETRYFPLGWWVADHAYDDEVGYRELVAHIPLNVMGWTYDSYDEISSDGRVGLQLMTYLLEHPYEEHNMVSLAEACAENVPEEMLQRMPQGGIKSAEAHGIFDNTKFAPIAMLCDWFNASTGNFFLDTDEEYLGYNMGWPEWTREWVNDLTSDWQGAELFMNEVYAFAGWLEEDPPARFEEILDFLEGKERKDKCQECGEKVKYMHTATDMMKRTWDIYGCVACGHEQRIAKEVK